MSRIIRRRSRRIGCKENSKITKAAVKDLKLPSDLTIGGLVRNGHGMVVTGNTWIQPNDHVVIFCLDTALHKIEKPFQLGISCPKLTFMSY